MFSPQYLIFQFHQPPLALGDAHHQQSPWTHFRFYQVYPLCYPQLWLIPNKVSLRPAEQTMASQAIVCSNLEANLVPITWAKLPRPGGVLVDISGVSIAKSAEAGVWKMRYWGETYQWSQIAIGILLSPNLIQVAEPSYKSLVLKIINEKWVNLSSTCTQ